MSQAIITARISSHIHTEVLEFVFETGDEVNLEAFNQKIIKGQCSRVHVSEGSVAAGSDYFGPSVPATEFEVLKIGQVSAPETSASEIDASIPCAPETPSDQTASSPAPEPVEPQPAPSSEPQATV